MQVKSIGIIGYGQFGQFVAQLAERFVPETELRICSGRSATEAEWQRAATADVVIVCVPIACYIATLEKVSDFLGPQSILVDVATVKELTTNWFQTQPAFSGRYLCTHPMFGPASYRKSGDSVGGFRLVVTDHNLADDTYRSLLTWLTECGLRVISMSAEAHDRYLAETLFLTHFIAQSVTEAGFVRTDIDTVSFGYLMDAVESVRDDVSLFQDVYAHNPHCAQVLNRLQAAVSDIQAKLQQ